MDDSNLSGVRSGLGVRYLTADAKTAELPASSVAITPANYPFRYIGAVPLGEHRAYAFRITALRRNLTNAKQAGL